MSASSSYNFAAAFVEFSRKTELEEIAIALAIPLPLLKKKVFQDGWVRLAAALPTSVGIGPRAERDLAKIQANREKCLHIAQELQEDLLEVVRQLRSKELKISKTTSKGETIVVDPSIKDRVDLANYAKTVADLSYKALGDLADARPAEGGGAFGGAPGSITIILPPVVAQPRAERAYDVDSEIVGDPPAWRTALPGAVVEAELLPDQGNGSSTQPIEDTMLDSAITPSTTPKAESGKDCPGPGP